MRGMENNFSSRFYQTSWKLLVTVSPFPFKLTRCVYFFGTPAVLLAGVLFTRGWIELVSAFLLGSLIYRTFWNIISYLVGHESSRVGIKSRTRAEIEPWAAKYLQVDCTKPLYKEIFNLIYKK